MCRYFRQLLIIALLESAEKENDRSNEMIVNLHKNYVPELEFELESKFFPFKVDPFSGWRNNRFEIDASPAPENV